MVLVALGVSIESRNGCGSGWSGIENSGSSGG